MGTSNILDFIIIYFGARALKIIDLLPHLRYDRGVLKAFFHERILYLG